MKVGVKMNNAQAQKIYQICSYLLSYPDEELIESIDYIQTELDAISIPSIKSELKQFCQKAQQFSKNEWIATYVYTFDFGKKTNLYVTYMSNGEQRERGMDLLFIKNYYKMHGFHVTDKELPDYLPILLEFAGQVDWDTIKPIFERYLSNIQEIADHLNPDENLYGHLFKCILLTIEHSGITQPVRRSDDICSNSFSG
jgi:nitrate reductase molybdenum cofactor assembly chaperone NarJ/NarW